ncbi:hypothetical protein MRB53_008548 [Persea americana]|uniref:Uncharacterized protein n=1 Tax=Persea americana TaxID=3435 RepID=A0ACC2MME2_PERAE|nr:hypothetical protein MRB53_008548 [Persea americana]
MSAFVTAANATDFILGFSFPELLLHFSHIRPRGFEFHSDISTNICYAAAASFLSLKLNPIDARSLRFSKSSKQTFRQTSGRHLDLALVGSIRRSIS